MELCPICIDNTAEYYTECNHKYCICCLSKIKQCALCRKHLLRTEICSEIRKDGTINVNIIQHETIITMTRFWSGQESLVSTEFINIDGTINEDTLLFYYSN
jgi:hypothetical protein